MKLHLRSKLAITLASLIIVPVVVVIIAIAAIRFDVINVPLLQDLKWSQIRLSAPGKDPEALSMVPIVFFSVFLTAMLTMVVVVSKILSDFVLLPLKELNYATERMTKGDLDFKIHYDRPNEFGKLCHGFDDMKNQLRLSIQKQEVYEESRKQLIASITHDLKTPLTSIIGYVEGLQDGVVSDPKMVNNYLNVIHDKSMRLDHLIDDLFTFTQIELEKFQVNPEPASIKPLLTEYIHTKTREFHSKPALSFEARHPVDDAMVNVDDFRLGQVLENLIRNAEKYTKTYIKIYTDTDDLFYNIYVEDDGVGISKEDLPFIFDYFYQCDKSRKTKDRGTGLGLAICKQLIDAHDGKIYVTSQVDQGTIFKISLKKIKA